MYIWHDSLYFIYICFNIKKSFHRPLCIPLCILEEKLEFNQFNTISIPTVTVLNEKRNYILISWRSFVRDWAILYMNQQGQREI